MANRPHWVLYENTPDGVVEHGEFESPGAAKNAAFHLVGERLLAPQGKRVVEFGTRAAVHRRPDGSLHAGCYVGFRVVMAGKIVYTPPSRANAPPLTVGVGVDE